MMVASVNVTGLNTTVTIKIPINPRNSTATHYRLYRSEVKDQSTDSSFPIGELIAEPAIPGSTSTGNDDQFITVIDGASQTSAYVYPTAIATATSWTATANGVDGSGHYSDATYMTKNVQVGSGAPVGGNVATFSVRTWNMSATVTADPISALEVAIQGKITAVSGSPSIVKASVQAQVSFDNGVSWSGYVSLGEFSTTNGELTSGMRNWGRTSLSREDLLDANFIVRAQATVHSASSAPRTSTISIDGVRVRANFNGTSGILTSPYPGIVVTVGKQSYVCSRNGQPPVATTGAIFQGSLVTDDTTSPSNLRWSIPGDPEAFPTLYYLPIETPNNDRISYIGMVNNVCIVGLQNSIVRLNYLPSEDDASFTRTRIYDFISRDLGILSPRAACTFLSPEGRELLACVTQDGIYVTDGFTFMKWDQDYTFVRDLLTYLVLLSGSVYDPRWLQLTNDVSTGNLLLAHIDPLASNRCIIHPFSYAARHLKSGPRFKLGLQQNGPVAAAGLAITSFTTTGGKIATYTALNNSSASTLVSWINLGALNYTPGGVTSPLFVTRAMQFREGFDDVIIDAAYIHIGGISGSTADMTISPSTNVLDESTAYSKTAVTFPTASKVAKADLSFNGYQTKFTVNRTTFSTIQMINRLIIEYSHL
jgi:hypothetical protein